MTEETIDDTVTEDDRLPIQVECGCGATAVMKLLPDEVGVGKVPDGWVRGEDGVAICAACIGKAEVVDEVGEDLPNGDDVIAAVNKGDGALQTVISRVVDAGSPSCEAMDAILEVLGGPGVSNKNTCPCGSGALFKHCCKAMRQLLVRGNRRWKEGQENPKAKEDDERDEAGNRWVLRIGFDRLNRPVVEPVDQEAAKALGGSGLCMMLLRAYHDLNLEFVTGLIRSATRRGKR